VKVLVDTNVLLDVLQAREPHYPASVAIWDMAERGDLTALVSAISFNNIYYIVTRLGDRRRAARALRLLRGTFGIVPLDPQIIDQAIDAKLGDFEDAIQFFSAHHAAADFILTRNAKDFPKSAIPALSPEEFLAIIGQPEA